MGPRGHPGLTSEAGEAAPGKMSREIDGPGAGISVVCSFSGRGRRNPVLVSDKHPHPLQTSSAHLPFSLLPRFPQPGHDAPLPLESRPTTPQSHHGLTPEAGRCRPTGSGGVVGRRATASLRDAIVQPRVSTRGRMARKARREGRPPGLLPSLPFFLPSLPCLHDGAGSVDDLVAFAQGEDVLRPVASAQALHPPEDGGVDPRPKLRGPASGAPHPDATRRSRQRALRVGMEPTPTQQVSTVSSPKP